MDRYGRKFESRLNNKDEEIKSSSIYHALALLIGLCLWWNYLLENRRDKAKLDVYNTFSNGLKNIDNKIDSSNILLESEVNKFHEQFHEINHSDLSREQKQLLINQREDIELQYLESIKK